MKKFDYMETYGYEQLVYFHDRNTGLKGAICIHNTVLGPALGGTRLWMYDEEDDAILDVLRLARGMTYKAACAGLNLGGGKAVIIGDSKELKKDTVRREAFWRAFGRYVQSLNGRYITAEDVGTCTADMDYIHCETDYVTGLSGTSGDPSPFTARGVYKGIKAAVKEKFGSAKLEGMTVAVQGLGNVGYHLCRHLHEDGAKLIVTDIDSEKIAQAVAEFGAVAVGLDEIYDVECDVYAPCALGATVNENTIPRLKCKIIAGAANNVLKDSKVHGQQIHDMGFIYVPDYVINAGGLINVYQEIHGYNRDTVIRNIDLIFDRVREIIRLSMETNRPTYIIADEFAERRIEMMKNVQSIHVKK